MWTYAVLATVLALAIGAEWSIAHRRGVRIHDARQLASDLACGATNAAAAVGSRAIQVALYVLVPQLVTLPADSVLTWLVGLVVFDLCYYAAHRAGHRSRLLWAAHGVHHQSSDFNLASGFRQGVLVNLLSMPFYLPLALLGVPVAVFVGLCVLHPALLFWTHSRFIGDCGPVGWVLLTPSHHRLHHDAVGVGGGCNFGGMLVVWDRLFGTVADERQVGPPVCLGDVDLANQTRNPLTANLIGWRDLIARRPRAPRRTRAVDPPQTTAA